MTASAFAGHGIEPTAPGGDVSLYTLEAAVLVQIAAEFQEQEAELLAQFRVARVIERRNTGAGFFTSFVVDREIAAPVTLPPVIGNVWVEIDGFQNPMVFLVFTQDGYAKILEGAAVCDNTSETDFRKVTFRLQT